VTVDLSGTNPGLGEAAGDTFIRVEGVVGSGFADHLYGDGGANALQGRDGNDALEGGGGNDVLDGGNGDDTADGGADDDALYGGAGVDTLRGGSGQDYLYGGTEADVLDGGAGFDYARYDLAAAGVTVDLSGTVPGLGDAAGDSFVQVEGIVGSPFADRVDGDGGANILQGRNGDDRLDGGAGADQLSGGADNDQFVFKPGEANGDKILDFDGNGALAADELIFEGFGPGATFTQASATTWRIDYLFGLRTEIITLTNAATVDPSDYTFI
jgi:Ca2+-binding RTX toxin-like protein